MSTPESTETPVAALPAVPVTDPSTKEAAAASPKEPTASPGTTGSSSEPLAEPMPPAGKALPSPPAASSSAAASTTAGDGGEESADDAEERPEDEEGAAAEGAAPSAEGEKKKRRRRRRKKKPGAAAEAPQNAQGEGAPAELPVGEGEASSQGAEGERAPPAEAGPDASRPPKPPRKPKPEKERPAFNVGDVVFGKVIEITEDVLFIDLSGKAKAIFDLRELLITEEDAKADLAAEEHDDHDDHAVEDRAEARGVEGAEPADGAPSNASADATSASAEASQEAAESTVEAAPVAVPSPPAAQGEARRTAKAEEPAVPQLPRVILEPGAPFVGVVHNDGGRGGLVVLTHHPRRARRAKPLVAQALRDRSLVFGIVTGVIKGGVEVDVDGLRAFAPGSHMDLRLGADLSAFVGKRLGFAVTQYGKRGRDVVLSRRAMLETDAKDRREEALKNLQIGAVVDGIVRTVVPFGAFLDIGGVEGLVPLSEMSHNRGDQPRDVFKVGETMKVKILRVDEKQKVWLSRRAAVGDPWSAVAEKYAVGTRHVGKIARLKPFGAFIELEPGVDGLIQVGDLSVKRINHPSEVLKEGESIDVVVAHVEAGSHRISLHPAPSGPAADEAPQKIAVNRTVKVQVVTAEATGLTVRILGATGRNARGFISAGGTGTPRGADLRKEFPPGKELDAKIIEIDPRRGELKLSIKSMNEDTERNAYQQYRAQVKREAKFGTLADLLQKRNIVPQK